MNKMNFIINNVYFPFLAAKYARIEVVIQIVEILKKNGNYLNRIFTQLLVARL